MSMNSNKEVHVYHADAGSGKTHRMMQIITEHVKAGIPLHRIAFVTYTKAAAEVAKQRVCEQFGIDIKEAPYFRTIHSMCFQHLGMHVVQMMDDQKYKDMGDLYGYAFGRINQPRTLEDVDWNNMTDNQIVAFEQLYRLNPPQAQWLLENKISNSKFAQYCRDYIKYKSEHNYKDFTDLLEDYIKQDLWEDVDVACIDEAQDCSPLQWKVLLKAFRNAHYIYVVGDVKQEIYGFNGSDSSIILRLRGIQHTLDKSYRVPENINNFVRDHIVRYMRDITTTECLSERKGGEVKFLTTWREIPSIDFNKSYLFLARNKKFLFEFRDICEDLRIPYSVFNKPVFSNMEKEQFRDGLTATWDEKKLQLAKEYEKAGTFYNNSVVRIDTIHGVKGDEADIVVLMPDLSRLTFKEYAEDPNNEHKVFYVAVTRARETLYILEPHTKFFYRYLFN